MRSSPKNSERVQNAFKERVNAFMNALNFIHERLELYSSLNDKDEGSSIGCTAAAAVEGCVSAVLRSTAPALVRTRSRGVLPSGGRDRGWPPS